MAPPSLLGPPELHKPSPTTTTADDSNPATGEPFIDLMVSNFNDISTTNLPMGRTENNSATYLSSGDPCLDLFFHVVPNTPSDYLTDQLPKAWDHDPLTTLKLLCNLRGVRGTGKADKEGFHVSAFWLHSHHPKTLACNLASFAEFGYFKDLPEFLYRLLEGDDVRKKQKKEWRETRLAGMRKRSRSGQDPGSDSETGSGSEKKKKKRIKSEVPREEREKKAKEWQTGEKAKASRLRKEKKLAMAKRAIGRYHRDPNYRFLHDRVSDLFAECLKSDIESLKSNHLNKITLAAKWCPSNDSSFDRATLICEGVAKKIFPRELEEYEGVEEEHYAYRVRDRLRREVLVPLRKALELPEIYMGANEWGKIPYNRVASVAMKLYKDKFKKHDEERFNKYLEDVKAGKAKIAAGALLPHEIVESLNDGEGDNDEVAELQWKRMVDDMVKLGKMNNCLAVCDVSGSMEGTPLEVAVALGLLVSELSEDPWKGLVVTFSKSPQLHLVQGESLKEKSEFVRRIEDWGSNTDFQKVFDLILKVAVKGCLKPEHMIKRVFVFSDMEFDEASGNKWETDYEMIEKKFKQAGYGDAIPQLVFWNLRHSRSIPVPGNQKGTALLSGFSKNLMKLFLDNDGEVRPDKFMELAIAGPEYQKLVVLD